MKFLMKHIKLKKIINFIEILYVFILLFYLSFFIIIYCTNSKGILGYHFFSIEDNSMKKTYNIHDIIFVKKINPSKLKVDNDIAYYGRDGGLDGKLIIHRIVRIEKNKNGKLSFITKGTNSIFEDPPIQEDKVIGKVKRKLSVMSQIHRIFKDPVRFFIFVFCPLFFMMMIEIIKTMKNIKNDKLSIRNTFIKNNKKDNKTTKENNKDKNSISDIPQIIKVIDIEKDTKNKKK